MSTLAELVSPKSQATYLSILLTEMQARGLPASDWHEGSVPKTLLLAEALGLSSLDNTVAAIAKGGSLDDATGAWLTLLAKQRYNVTRKLALPTQGTVRLTAAVGAGPYTIVPGQLWVATSSGKRYRNITGGTLASGGTLDLTWQAESPGSSYNVASVSITLLLTPLAGVTVSNPASPWRTQSGTDDETDASLRQRSRDMLPSLGPGATAAAYRSWALTASAEITRVRVSKSPGTGDVSILVASSAGSPSADAVEDAQASINERCPLTDAPTVVAAEDVAVNVTATIYGSATAEAAARARIQDDLAALINATEIGGTLYLAEIIEVLMRPTGVRNAVIATPATNVTLAADDVAVVGTITLTYVAI